MTSIYWLASYPKSGNTWMRIFLTNYLRGGESPADINRLEGGPIASARVWFDEWAGIEASALDDGLVEALRPGVYRCMVREESQTVYMKVHDRWSRTNRGEGLFPADVTGGVIYIVRNPLDMAASCANHWGITVAAAVERLCDPDYTLARSLGGLADQLMQKMGTWSDHVTSWLDRSGLAVHPVRYEDLKADPIGFFGNVIRFSDFEYDEARLHRAVAFSSFGEVQRQEQEKGFRERSTVAPESFFRKGRTGGWREELSPDQVHRIIEVNAETMSRFGYLDKNYQPV